MTSPEVTHTISMYNSSVRTSHSIPPKCKVVGSIAFHVPKKEEFEMEIVSVTMPKIKQ